MLSLFDGVWLMASASDMVIVAEVYVLAYFYFLVRKYKSVW